jgi:hypothetical protein
MNPTSRMLSLACLLMMATGATLAADHPSVKFRVETRAAIAQYEISGNTVSGERTHVEKGRQTLLAEVNDDGIIAVKRSPGVVTSIVINFSELETATKDLPYNEQDVAEARTFLNEMRGKTIIVDGLRQKSGTCRTELDDMIDAADAMMDACVLDDSAIGCVTAARMHIEKRNTCRKCEERERDDTSR